MLGQSLFLKPMDRAVPVAGHVNKTRESEFNGNLSAEKYSVNHNDYPGIDYCSPISDRQIGPPKALLWLSNALGKFLRMQWLGVESRRVNTIDFGRAGPSASRWTLKMPAGCCGSCGTEIEASITTGTPMDKAGAYATQDQELRPGEMVSGCYSNVIGLPICRLLEMLAELMFPAAAGISRVGGQLSSGMSITAGGES